MLSNLYTHSNWQHNAISRAQSMLMNTIHLCQRRLNWLPTGCILIILLYKTKVADTYVKLQQQDQDLWRNFCFRTTSLWRCKQLMNLCLMSISVCVEGNGLVMFLGFITVDLHLTNRLQLTVDVTQFNHKLTADS